MLIDMKEDMEKVNSHIHRLLHSDNATMSEVIEYVLQASGKQLRPRLLMLFAGIDKEAEDAAEFAAIIEIVHLASLVHDDIIDDADIRRGQLSVQKKYGRHLAVYTGDFMIFSVLKNSTVKSDRRYQQLFASLTSLCYGELGQEAFRYNTEVTAESYLENINGKTATMFELACELGAALSSGKKQTIENAKIYGNCLGILFQIRDDLLDFDIKTALNKPSGADFANGIYTMPVIYALQNKKAREEILTVKADTAETLTEENAQKIINAVNLAEGFDKTFERAGDFYRSAKSALSAIKAKKQKNLQVAEEMLDELFGDIRARCEKYSSAVH